MKTPMTTRTPHTREAIKKLVDRITDRFLNGEISSNDVLVGINKIVTSNDERVWARKRIEWRINNASIVGSLPRTIEVAMTCKSIPPKWCAKGIAPILFAVACMRPFYPFPMAQNKIAETFTGLLTRNLASASLEQRRMFDRIKAQVRRFIECGMKRGFLRHNPASNIGGEVPTPDESKTPPRKWKPPTYYTLTASGVEMSVSVLKDNPSMLEYSKQMGWYNDDGIPY